MEHKANTSSYNDLLFTLFRSDKLKPKVISTKNVLLGIFVVLLLGTTLYFGFRTFNVRERIEVPQDAFNEKLINSEEPFETPTNNRVEDSSIQLPTPEDLQDHESNERKETSTSENSSSENGIFHSESEKQITEVQAAIFLKAMLRNMVCVMGSITPTTISCCGKMTVETDPDKDKEACILLDSYNISLPMHDSDVTIYRLRMIQNKDILIYKEVEGFPKQGSECFPLKNHPGVDICASVNLLALDNDVADDLGYESCTYMKFGYGKLEKDLLGYDETVKCASDKELLIKKSLNSPDSIIIRLKLKSVEETPEIQSESTNNISSPQSTEEKVPENKTDDVINSSNKDVLNPEQESTTNDSDHSNIPTTEISVSGNKTDDSITTSNSPKEINESSNNSLDVSTQTDSTQENSIYQEENSEATYPGPLSLDDVFLLNQQGDDVIQGDEYMNDPNQNTPKRSALANFFDSIFNFLDRRVFSVFRRMFYGS